MSENEIIQENQEELGQQEELEELEQLDDYEPVLERDDPEYVASPKGTRFLAWILAIIVIIGVILYLGWISGVLHE